MSDSPQFHSHFSSPGNNSSILMKYLHRCHENSEWPPQIKATQSPHLQGLKPSLNSLHKHAKPVTELLTALKARPRVRTEERSAFTFPFPPHLAFSEGSIPGRAWPLNTGQCCSSIILLLRFLWDEDRRRKERASQHQFQRRTAGLPQFKSEHDNSLFASCNLLCIEAQTNPVHLQTVTSWLVKPMCKFVTK